jgi:hypothetical protein
MIVSEVEMNELLENEHDIEEVYLRFAFNCLEGVKKMPLEDFFKMENNLYDNFLEGFDPRGARTA